MKKIPHKNVFRSLLLIQMLFFTASCVTAQKNSKVDYFNKGVYSIETDLTITKVRTAEDKKQSYVVATSYEGSMIAVSYNGDILWKNKLSGFMNHDIWAADINKDGND